MSLPNTLSVGNVTPSGVKEVGTGTVSPTRNEPQKGDGFVCGKSLGNF